MSEPQDTEPQRLLDRVAEIARSVRATWFLLLGVLAFAGVTLLGVEDADFFAVGRQTALPLVGVEIPTRSFFLTAPILVTALYGYFHFQLRELWAALAAAAPRLAWPRFVQAVHPGLIVAAGLGFHAESREERTALDRLQRIVVVALLWWAAPVVLVLLWWRAMPAHEEWLTLAGAASLFVGGFVGWKSFAEARHLLGDGARPRPRRPVWALLAVGLVVLSWMRTEGGLDHYVDRAMAWWNRELPERALTFGDDTDVSSIEEEDARLEWIAAQWWIPQALIWEHARFWDYPLWLVSLAPVDLAGVELIPRPDDWRQHEVAREAFRDAWCDRKGHDPATCADLGGDLEDFEDAWDEERTATLDNLARAPLANADLRAAQLQRSFLARGNLGGARLEGANLAEARLEGAKLRRARLEGADLWRARLEGADLGGARLEGAVLWRARLEGADLYRARLQGAGLAGARLERAVLTGARLEGASLAGARLERAVLAGARLEGADLYRARLERADLREARLEGADLAWAGLEDADLREARLEDADLRQARLEGAVLREARLEGADLDSAVLSAADFTGTRLNKGQIDGAIGDADTVLPRDAETGEQLYVWSCWEEPPRWLDLMLAPYPEARRQDLRERWLCNGRRRKPVGRPAPEPEEAPENGGGAEAAPAP